MEELRKVLYCLEKDPGYGYFDLDGLPEEKRNEIEEQHRMKQGLFHRWGDHTINEEDGLRSQITVAIIEDLDTHKVCKIDPELIQFI